MWWVDSETLGPNVLSYYAAPYLWFALPNLLLTSALFFALATMTRSMMATYLGVVGFLILWTVASVVLDRNPAYELAGAYGEPFGIGAYSYVTKYWTAADRNALVAPVRRHAVVQPRDHRRDRARCAGPRDRHLPLRRAPVKGEQARAQAPATGRNARRVGPPETLNAPLPTPSFGRATAFAQLRARTRLELGQVFKSPAFFVLMALGLFNAAAAMIDLGEVFGTPVLPVTRVLIGLLEGSFSIIPVIIAIYYAGELVWRERDRKIHEIIDASAIPDWAYVVPKALAVVLVLFSTLLVSVVAGLVTQLLHGYTDFELGKYLLWYVLPDTIDFTLIAILAVFIQALSPNKYLGWGLMVFYFIIIRVTLRNLGFGDALYNYGQIPGVPLSDMNGHGRFWIGAWWLRLYWTALRGDPAGARARPVAARHGDAAAPAARSGCRGGCNGPAGLVGGRRARGVRRERGVYLHQHPCLEPLHHARRRRCLHGRL